MIPLICEILKSKMNVSRKTETNSDIENKLVVFSGKRKGKRGKIGYEVKTQKLLYIK